MTTFRDMKIGEQIIAALDENGFEEAFPIQQAAIPVLLTGRDVIGQAHTGTGKTAAYSISMLEKLQPGSGIQGLVIAPTRELAVQISVEIEKFAKYTKLRVATIYGGQSMGPQLDAIKRGVEILVATPGRLIDHLKRGSITLDDVSYLVLDEADTMLDMGFIDDIQFIMDLTQEEKVVSLFSATMPVEILRLAENYLRNPKQFLLDSDDLSGEGIDQSFLVIRDKEKMDHLANFIKQNGALQSIVFCSTKYRTRDVAHDLRKMDFNSVAIEGDMSQHRREQSMTKFRSGKADILVATDVASRGIDVPHVGLVVNYDVPNQELTYFHRIGRTARAGAKGKAITLVSYSSAPDFEVIKRKVKVEMTDLNKEMGIEVDIPDPLKRQVSRRGFGRGGGGGRDRNSGRDNRRFERRPRRDGDGGGRFDRSSGGGRFDRSSGGGRFDRSSRPSGGRFDRSSGGGRFDRSSGGGRSDRSGGSFDRSSRPSGGRYDRNSSGGRFDRSSRPSGGRYDRNNSGGSFDRSSGGGRSDRSGGRFDRSSRPSGGRYDRNSSGGSFDRSSRPSGGRFNRNDDRKSDGSSERGGGRFERNDRSEKKSFGNNDDRPQNRDSTFREKRKRSF